MELLHIGVVERETGVPRDVLRVWERRYRFPRPRRDKLGDRVYTRAQVEKLQLIRRLMDAGHRAGEVVGRSGPELLALLRRAPRRCASTPARSGGCSSSLPRAAAPSCARHSSAHCRPRASRRSSAKCWRRSTPRWAAPGRPAACRSTGSTSIPSWCKCSCAKPSRQLPISRRAPCVLLTTLPGEQHELGLLMLQALYRSAGVQTVLLGTQTPRDQIVDAARVHAADAVAVSFSSAFPRHRLQREVRELRQALPARIDVWMGGDGVKRLRGRIPGIRAGRSLPDALALPEAWKAGQKVDAR